ncbi:5564_t:CDS:2, partial [Gigaspora rosea]
LKLDLAFISGISPVRRLTTGTNGVFCIEVGVGNGSSLASESGLISESGICT